MVLRSRISCTWFAPSHFLDKLNLLDAALRGTKLAQEIRGFVIETNSSVNFWLRSVFVTLRLLGNFQLRCYNVLLPGLLFFNESSE